MIYRGLRVRMGVHIGKPIVEKDPVTGRFDYFGPMVNRSARVEGQAAGGQIVISNAVWEIIKGKLDTYSIPVWSKYMGIVALKGMDEPETVRTILPYQLRNRKFPEVKVIVDDKTGLKLLEEKEDESSLKDLQNQLKTLHDEHTNLQQNKAEIKGKIQFKIRMKALENNLIEKDSIIEFLKAKIDNPSSIAMTEIDTVMKRYDVMKLEFLEMKKSYDEAYEMFDEDNEVEKIFTEVREMKDIVQVLPDVTSGSWTFAKEKYENELEQMQKLIKQRERRIFDLKTTLKAARRVREKKHQSPLKKRFGEFKNLSKNRLKYKQHHDLSMDSHEESFGNDKKDEKPKPETPKNQAPSNKSVEISSKKMKNLMKAKLNSPNHLSQSLPRGGHSRYEPNIRPIVSSASASRSFLPVDRIKPNSSISRSSEFQPNPIVPSSVGDITSILKDAIQEAIGMSSDSKNLNWDSFIQGVSKNVVEDVPSSPVKTESPDVNKNIIIFDDKTNQYVQIAKDSLKKWGVINAAKFIAEQQFKAGLTKKRESKFTGSQP